MTEAQTYAWIFYASSLASQGKAAGLTEIEMAADAINHAKPTQVEFSSSVIWLKAQGLLEENEKEISLSEEGLLFFSQLSKKGGSAMKVWEYITNAIEERGVDNRISLNCGTMEAD